MKSVQHQIMGYDRNSTMFSPDGRLLQVEYAKKTVKQGSATIGIVCKDGVLLLTDKRVNEKLMVVRSVEKIFKIDDHIGAASTGLVMDGRILMEKSQLIAQQHSVIYDGPIELVTLVKDICDIKHSHTQYGWGMPFAVYIFFAALNNRTELYVTNPTGF